MSKYLDVAHQGRNEWWRYLISLPAILMIWFLVGSIPVVLLMSYVAMDGDPVTGFSATGFTGISVIVEFIFTMSSFIPLLVGTLMAVRLVHSRPLKTLVTGEAQIRWGRSFAAAGVWLLIAAVLSTAEALLYPGRYVLTFQPLTWAIFAILALLLIPLQTSAEEFFFRGYLLQWMGLRLKNWWLLSLLNGLLFFLPHAANPEMATGSVLIGLGYFAMGFFLALITLRDNGIELALGMHAGNNLFASLFANYSVTALPSPSLFTVQTLDPVYSLVSLLVGLVVFYFIFFRPTRSETVKLPG